VLELARVAHDDLRLDRLLQLYMHEWSALVATPIDAEARYTYRDLPAWSDRERHAAYLIVDEVPIGFALIARDDAGTWHVEEFFVIAGARRRGAGAIAAQALFAAHPGTWTWTVRPENPAALAFWRRVAPDARVSAEPGVDGITRTRMVLGG
jgi:predicted acetyltransferase